MSPWMMNDKLKIESLFIDFSKNNFNGRQISVIKNLFLLIFCI